MPDTPPPDAPRVRFPPPLAFLGAVMIGWALDRWVTGWRLPLADAVRWPISGVLIVMGLALAGPALLAFRRARENPEPWTPSKRLIISGWYRYTRNPMYLGMMAISVGLAFLLASVTTLLLLPLLIWLIQTKVIEREEAYLLRRFGEDYAAYMTRVRRWI